MDLKLLIFVNSILLGTLKAGTPALCRMSSSDLDLGEEGDLGVGKYYVDDKTDKLETSETTEPDSSGDAEMSSGDESLSELMNPNSQKTPVESDAHVAEDVESALQSESEEGALKSDEDSEESAKSNTRVDAKSEKTEEEFRESDVLKLLFEDVSTEYSDDYAKSVDDGKEMDPEKEYSVKSYVPGESILVLATPSGCSLMDFEGTEEGPQMVEFKFTTSQLDDCVKLNEDILNEMTDHLARQVAQTKGPTTKMVEISVRDPMRNSQLNIRETTKVFSTGHRDPGESLEEEEYERGPESEFVDDLRSKFENEEIVTDEEDKKDARMLLSEILNFDFLPTNSDSVYVMSYSFKEEDSEEALEREQLLNEFYSTRRSGDGASARGASGKRNGFQNRKKNEKSEKFESLFKSMENFTNEKFEKVIGEMKRLLETEEGKKELEKISKKLQSQFEKTRDLLQKEVNEGKQILSDLSKHGVESVECSGLKSEECSKYSKCEMMDVDGKEMCFVSPKTIYWLLETSCGLQSKSALMSIARDLNRAGIMSTRRVSHLEQSFDPRKICNAITHAYLSKLAPKEDQQPNRAFNHTTQ
ncbi:conserved hypothetical protein [Theileria orientalis strain Shintoku]|uniref:Uncharacterized protein n=1 Tax=Theileria orientalis strain Shintoku TaxID=869250 RepID=J4C300_THEOR|nr:conserved hypothetical protein [Theileria orientalis strain Shintoku]BAM39576.1 conserved hypothetical protein [Theileria orientalis strain Shintoku]|eukprot:XP_009689877.1 conserved hypothetical protein [Theileria orientalis strain Shintoku]